MVCIFCVFKCRSSLPGRGGSSQDLLEAAIELVTDPDSQISTNGIESLQEVRAFKLA